MPTHLALRHEGICLEIILEYGHALWHPPLEDFVIGMETMVFECMNIETGLEVEYSSKSDSLHLKET